MEDCKTPDKKVHPERVQTAVRASFMESVRAPAEVVQAEALRAPVGLLQAEEPPAIVVGPPCRSMAELDAWMLGQHVQLCAKGGIDCRTCDRAEELGIPRAKSS